MRALRVEFGGAWDRRQGQAGHGNQCAHAYRYRLPALSPAILPSGCIECWWLSITKNRQLWPLLLYDTWQGRNSSKKQRTPPRGRPDGHAMRLLGIKKPT